MDDVNDKQVYAINLIFTQALLLLPILAWNGLINELLGKLFPRRNEHVWVMLAYAVIITVVAIAVYVLSPLRMPPVVELRTPPVL